MVEEKRKVMSNGGCLHGLSNRSSRRIQPAAVVVFGNQDGDLPALVKWRAIGIDSRHGDWSISLYLASTRVAPQIRPFERRKASLTSRSSRCPLSRPLRIDTGCWLCVVGARIINIFLHLTFRKPVPSIPRTRISSNRQHSRTSTPAPND